MSQVLREAYASLLAADLSVTVDAHPAAAAHVEWVIRHEVERLEAIFNPHDPHSEFSQWRLGRLDAISPDLLQVLILSERFWVFSKGAFHPGAEPLRRRWREAQATARCPSRSELRDLAGRLELPYTTMHGPALRLGDCSEVDVTPLVRGYILDSAVATGWELGLASGIALRAGHDIVHRGCGSVRLDPGECLGIRTHRPELVELRDAACSGVRARAGAPETVDPHTGCAAEHDRAVAAIAPDAVTALVGAAALAIRGEGTGLPGCTWLVATTKDVFRAPNWPFVGRTTPGC